MDYLLFKTKATATSKEYLAKAVQMVVKNLNGNKKDYKVFNILTIGRLLEGEAYYHEVDQYYRCVGFEVEIESQFEYEIGGQLKTSEVEKTIGFYSIWVGKSHSASPIDFDLGYRPMGENHRFENGLGDHIEVVKEVASFDEVKQIVDRH